LRGVLADRFVVAVKPLEWGGAKGPGHLWLCSFGQPGKAREELRGRAESTRQAV
jgi:hypothetical protein